MKIFRRKDEEAVSPVIAIILMVAITVVLASVLYVWVMNLAQTGEEAAKFPTIEVTLRDGGNSADDILRVKHIQGDPLDWTEYKMIITNNSDDKSTTMTNLNNLETQTAGESKEINTTVTITGFHSIDYAKASSYTIEIYDLQENKRVYQNNNIICQ
jgi:flagellin-like protein